MRGAEYLAAAVAPVDAHRVACSEACPGQRIALSLLHSRDGEVGMRVHGEGCGRHAMATAAGRGDRVRALWHGWHGEPRAGAAGSVRSERTQRL